MAMAGVVIRKDGTVPFDKDVDPDVKAQILGHLLARGHEIEKHPETGEHRIKGWKAGTAV